MWSLSLRVFTKEKSDESIVQLIRYFVTAVIATLIDYSIYVLCLSFGGFDILSAIILGFTIGVIVNYKLSVIWAFSVRHVQAKTLAWTVFTLTGIVGILINFGVVQLLTSQLLIDARAARLPAIASAFIWNFLSKKVLLFKN